VVLLADSQAKQLDAEVASWVKSAALVARFLEDQS
jgi:hypothetical protein